MAGRLSAVEKPALGKQDGVYGIEYAYDESGRLSKIHSEDAALLVVEYDKAGQLLHTGLDEGSEDRVTRYDSIFRTYSNWFKETRIFAYRQPGSYITDKAVEYVRMQDLGEDGLLHQRDLHDNWGGQSADPKSRVPD